MGKAAHNKGKGKVIDQLRMDGSYVRTWNSLADAGRDGYNISKISECANGTREHHRHYMWRFRDGKQSDDVSVVA